MAFEEIPDQPMKGIWKPKLGESVEGEVLHAEAGKYGMEHVLKTKEGNEIKLPSHKQLQSKLEVVKAGQYIRVTKIGEKASSKGQATQMYRVEIDKSYIPQTSLISNPEQPQTSPDVIKGILENIKFGQTMFPGGVVPESNVIQACKSEKIFKELKDKGLIVFTELKDKTIAWRVAT